MTTQNMTDFAFYRHLKDSLNPSSAIDRYDPRAPREYSPFMIEQFLIRRTPLRHTPYTKYSVVLAGDILGNQISYPSLLDCIQHQRLAKPLRKAVAMDAHLKERPTKDASLRGRIIDLLRGREMDMQTLAATMSKPAALLSAPLAALVREKVALRRGTVHRYLYRVRP
jgi:hypothetical protein